MKNNILNQRFILFILCSIIFLVSEKCAAQHYFSLETLKSIDLKEQGYDDVDFVHAQGYYEDNDGEYTDNYGDTMSINDDDGREVLTYKVAATSAAVNFYSDELSSNENTYLPYATNNYDLYYYSVYGRFSIHVVKLPGVWKLYLKAQKKGDFTPAYQNLSNQYEINSYTTTTGKTIFKGQKVYLKTYGRISLGTFAGDGTPDGIDGFTFYSCNNAFPHGSLLGKIGDNGNWFLIGSYKAFTADETGELKVMVNDCDAANNSGRFYLQCSINKELNP